ncbi:Bcutp7 [Botrytis cinerea B05.10]|uniref:U three protein 7 n=3 Tax=Botryotinia fuckeliana TaxID=40559 RepID=A0A384JS54_BOTFB|nr:Bcutp7 [Botrytis cinerea B05.10]ATZ53350.1 Bcutp7 [Botrytis cinerea B05.10]EMR88759.1 putative u3 small nucleolar rna-associated protein 7 protein [Botrytis cinerea BcDW1]CCD44425.1 similar to U3 small nucleolar RNA-associated protein 7 [Botrytis cinerea T4]
MADIMELTDNSPSNGAVPIKRARTELATTESESQSQLRRRKEANKAYGRGGKIPIHSIKDKKLRGNLKKLEARNKTAILRAKDAEILLENEDGFLEPENELERTYKVRQDEIKQSVPLETAKKGFELKLDQLGPYVCDYTRNGKDLLLAGRKGHVATMDWREGKLGCELQLGETVRDAKWLHNNQLFAVAQKKYVYIYDGAGVELHCLKKHIEVTNMEFLPYHYLLATVGNAGHLKYQDISTGQMVMEMPTKLGSPTSLTQNPRNAILHMGHQNGTVTLWSPNSTTPLVKLLAHRGPVRSLAVDREGRYMVSTGQDMKMSVWDVRMFKEVNSYFTRQPASSVAISDRGLTAVGWGTQVSIWRGLFSKSSLEQEKIQSPYMAWGGEGNRIERVRWCPFEDVLGTSHDSGFSSILVPGAGEANFDALEVNPFETTKQRQEAEVKSLLNKLQPEMISLDPNYIGNLDLRSDEQRKAEKDLDKKPEDPMAKIKNRGRGKNSSLRKYLRKKSSRGIIDDQRDRIEELRKSQMQREKNRLKSTEEELGPALGRFAKKSA